MFLVIFSHQSTGWLSALSASATRLERLLATLDGWRSAAPSSQTSCGPAPWRPHQLLPFERQRRVQAAQAMRRLRAHRPDGRAA